MRCPRCLNEDVTYFFLGSKGYYCRRCISFKRQLVDEAIDQEIEYPLIADYTINLKYDLTKLQKRISQEIVDKIDANDILLYCVCGAGKTEIVLDVIQYYLIRGKRVGYAISRRQVVLELTKRFREIFKSAKVVEVCQGFTKDIYGDLIVMTTHQLYRYIQAFDLLILDEPDAFPFAGNKVLQDIALNSVKGHVIYSTATLNDELLEIQKNCLTLTLNSRPHGYELPIPRLVVSFKAYLLFKIFYFIKKHNKVIVFVPTIHLAKRFSKLLNIFFKVAHMTSRSDNKQELIDSFREDRINVLVATTILERGVTFDGVEVIIYLPEHRVFTISSIIQMVGRVGRSFNNPTGDALILSDCYSAKSKEVIRILEEANKQKMSIMS